MEPYIYAQVKLRRGLSQAIEAAKPIIKTNSRQGVIDHILTEWLFNHNLIDNEGHYLGVFTPSNNPGTTRAQALQDIHTLMKPMKTMKTMEPQDIHTPIKPQEDEDEDEDEAEAAFRKMYKESTGKEYQEVRPTE